MRARNLSHEKVAQALGVSAKSVVNWEKDRGDPSASNVIALAELFGVSTDYLLGVTERASGTDPVEQGAQADLEAADEAALPPTPRVQPADERAARKRHRSA